MMQKIKYAMIFLMGVIYVSGWWGLFVVDIDSDLRKVINLLVLWGTVGIILGIGSALVAHWDD